MASPSAKAFLFKITASDGKVYDAYIDLLPGAGDDKFLDCRYRAEGTSDSWIYLIGPSIYPSQVTTTEDTDDIFDSSIEDINEKIAEVFGAASDIPLLGFDRIAWLVENGIQAINNVVSRI